MKWRPSHIAATYALLIVALTTLYPSDAVKSLEKYGMYVWKDAFDVDAMYCNGVYPTLKTGSYASCFQHSWETPAARERLWVSCSLPEREVGRIFLSDVKRRVENDGYADSFGNCDAILITTLEEAHDNGVEVYALYAVSDAAFSEKTLVADVNRFNINCGTKTGVFDGVAINNEHFSSIKRCKEDNTSKQIQVLQDLKTAADNASPLPLHFSVSWNWHCCKCSSKGYVSRDLLFNGQTQNAVEHMINITDSIDVQVAWNEAGTMEKRARRPYNYWASDKAGTTSSTAFYVLAYTNPNSDCRLSFSPHVKGGMESSDECSQGNRTEAGMFAAFDEVKLSQNETRGGIHYMGGVFSTGMPGWPKHEPSTCVNTAVKFKGKKEVYKSCGWVNKSQKRINTYCAKNKDWKDGERTVVCGRCCEICLKCTTKKCSRKCSTGGLS